MCVLIVWLIVSLPPGTGDNVFIPALSWRTLDGAVAYHLIRGQSVVKLYVIYNGLEIAEKLCRGIGQDLIDTLFTYGSRLVASRREYARGGNNRHEVCVFLCVVVLAVCVCVYVCVCFCVCGRELRLNGAGCSMMAARSPRYIAGDWLPCPPLVSLSNLVSSISQFGAACGGRAVNALFLCAGPGALLHPLDRAVLHR